MLRHENSHTILKMLLCAGHTFFCDSECSVTQQHASECCWITSCEIITVLDEYSQIGRNFHFLHKVPRLMSDLTSGILVEGASNLQGRLPENTQILRNRWANSWYRYLYCTHGCWTLEICKSSASLQNILISKWTNVCVSLLLFAWENLIMYTTIILRCRMF